MSLIHRYKSNGFNIVLDINSGCIHLVDDVTYEVLPYLEEGLSSDAIVEKLGGQYKKEDIETSVKECNKLKEDGMLFTQFRIQEKSGSGFLWRRAVDELASCKRPCKIWP